MDSCVNALCFRMHRRCHSSHIVRCRYWLLPTTAPSRMLRGPVAVWVPLMRLALLHWVSPELNYKFFFFFNLFMVNKQHGMHFFKRTLPLVWMGVT